MQQKTDSRLGRFAGLPLEIRRLIWLELAPAGRDRGLESVQKTDLSILRTSRHLYEEMNMRAWNLRLHPI